MKRIFTEDQTADIADNDLRLERIFDEADAILEHEGHYHVAGVYYANQDDATMQRMWEAERRVRERDRAMESWILAPRKTA